MLFLHQSYPGISPNIQGKWESYPGKSSLRVGKSANPKFKKKVVRFIHIHHTLTRGGRGSGYVCETTLSLNLRFVNSGGELSDSHPSYPVSRLAGWWMEDFDVVVVGAGVVGSATAHQLIQHQGKILLLEQV